MPHIYLTPPQLSPHHIQEKITCIRSHRERIFNTSVQTLGSKLIFHNYGHGGAGWTFLFGCVPASLEQFEQATANMPKKPICVIGAGCYGLLTAIELARAGHQVRIVAENIDSPSSCNAAGFFFPRARKCSSPQERAVFEQYGMASYRTYLAIARDDHPFIAHGARIVPAYYDPAIDPEFGVYVEHQLIQQPHAVSIDFGTGKRYAAHAYQLIFINAHDMMAALHTERVRLRIPIEQYTVSNFAEIPENIIFNCAGLGASALTHDLRLVPVQGHLITLRNQPLLNYLLNMKVVQHGPRGPRDELIYFAPKQEGILGITFLRGQDGSTRNEHEFERLLERSRQFFGT